MNLLKRILVILAFFAFIPVANAAYNPLIDAVPPSIVSLSAFGPLVGDNRTDNNSTFMAAIAWAKTQTGGCTRFMLPAGIFATSFNGNTGYDLRDTGGCVSFIGLGHKKTVITPLNSGVGCMFTMGVNTAATTIASGGFQGIQLAANGKAQTPLCLAGFQYGVFLDLYLSNGLSSGLSLTTPNQGLSASNWQQTRKNYFQGLFIDETFGAGGATYDQDTLPAWSGAIPTTTANGISINDNSLSIIWGNAVVDNTFVDPFVYVLSGTNVRIGYAETQVFLGAHFDVPSAYYSTTQYAVEFQDTSEVANCNGGRLTGNQPALHNFFFGVQNARGTIKSWNRYSAPVSYAYQCGEAAADNYFVEDSGNGGEVAFSTDPGAQIFKSTDEGYVSGEHHGGLVGAAGPIGNGGSGLDGGTADTAGATQVLQFQVGVNGQAPGVTGINNATKPSFLVTDPTQAGHQTWIDSDASSGNLNIIPGAVSGNYAAMIVTGIAAASTGQIQVTVNTNDLSTNKIVSGQRLSVIGANNTSNVCDGNIQNTLITVTGPNTFYFNGTTFASGNAGCSGGAINTWVRGGIAYSGNVVALPILDTVQGASNGSGGFRTKYTLSSTANFIAGGTQFLTTNGVTGSATANVEGGSPSGINSSTQLSLNPYNFDTACTSGGGTTCGWMVGNPGAQIAPVTIVESNLGANALGTDIIKTGVTASSGSGGQIELTFANAGDTATLVSGSTNVSVAKIGADANQQWIVSVIDGQHALLLGSTYSSLITHATGNVTWFDPSFTLFPSGNTTRPSPATGNWTLYDDANNSDVLSLINGSGVIETFPTTAGTILGGTYGANTMPGNWTSSPGSAASNAMPSCADSGGDHLNYVSGTGITCGSSSGPSGTLQSGTFGSSLATQTITFNAAVLAAHFVQINFYGCILSNSTATLGLRINYNGSDVTSGYQWSNATTIPGTTTVTVGQSTSDTQVFVYKPGIESSSNFQIVVSMPVAQLSTQNASLSYQASLPDAAAGYYSNITGGGWDGGNTQHLTGLTMLVSAGTFYCGGGIGGWYITGD
jgi:hypothetical protein